MKRTAVALAILGTFAPPAQAQDLLEVMKNVVENAAQREAPVSPSSPQPRSRLDDFMNPQVNRQARVEEGRICYGYVRTGGRPQQVCIPDKNFADTISEGADIGALAFSGNSLAVPKELLARCHIEEGLDPSLDPRLLRDPSVSQTLSLICPNANGNGGSVTLSIMFNPEYYLPLNLSDVICGPDKAIIGSEFDRYVRSNLGAPEAVDERPCSGSSCALSYTWRTDSSTLALSQRTIRSVRTCNRQAASQTDWSMDLMLNNGVGNRWVAYLETAAQRQRDGSFTPF